MTYKVGKTKILNQICCAFAISKFNVILGQNGSGKSTLLKCMSGLIKPSQGSVIFDEINLNSFSIREQSEMRSVLLQQNICSERLTVAEVLQLSTTQESKANTKYLNYLIEFFDIDTFLELEINFLSGGEQQRVHFVRVLNQLGNEDLNSKVLLLDEPISAADITYQIKFLEFVQTQVVNNGLTAIAILHDLSFSMKYADWIIGLKKGKLIKSCSKQRLLEDQSLIEIFDIDFDILKLGNNQIVVVPKTNRLYENKSLGRERKLSKAV